MLRFAFPSKHNRTSKVRGSKWKMPNTLKSIDVFKQPLPGFNIGGETSFGTMEGGIFTIALFFLLAVYGIHRFNVLVTKRNPNLTQLLLEGENDPMTGTYFLNDGFKIAYAVENYHSKDGMDDPRYVRWVSYLEENFDGVETLTPLPMKKCTEQDYSEFYPPQ